MNRIFPIPPPIIVPDGTELSEIIGPRLLGEGNSRINDGLSLALGKLPAGTISKVHVHPVVWHFTWVLTGQLTVAMKDADSEEPYQIDVAPENGVLTEAGTFFQLINRSDQPCEVFYIVGPAFQFELDSKGEVTYNDAVVFEHSWQELEELGWRPPELSNREKVRAARHASLTRMSAPYKPWAVGGERWTLRNGPGSVTIPSVLHHALTEITETVNVSERAEPQRTGQPADNIMSTVDAFLVYLQKELGLQFSKHFRTSEVGRFIRLECEEEPSTLAEFEQAARLVQLTTQNVHPDEIWHLLMFGQNSDLVENGVASSLARVRKHLLNPLIDLAVSVGGGFKSVGIMENYRAFVGGPYAHDESYRQYRPSR